MKSWPIPSITFILAVIAPLSLAAADPDPKAELTAAVKLLAEQANYGWKTTVVVPESARFKPGPTEGKTEKNGITWFKLTFGDRVTEAVMKGDKTAIASPEGEWKLASELEDAEGPARFLGRMARNLRTPATQAPDLIAATGSLKREGDVLAGNLTEEGARKQFRWGEPQNPKGTVRFWVKDGVLTKFEVKVSAKMEFNGEEMDASRTTTTEIVNAGSTKVEVPAEAKKKLM